MKILAPVPRIDIAETWESFLDTLVKRGHQVTVVTSPRLAEQFGYATKGMALVISEPYSRAMGVAGSGLRRRLAMGLIDLADTVEKYLLADRLIDHETLLMTYSNDSEQLRPFMDVARKKKAKVATAQMTFLYADAKRLIAADQKRFQNERSAASRLYRGVRKRVVGWITETPVYDGPRRIWGSDADLLFVADESQKKVFADAGVAETKLKVTGAPFMDMIRRRVDTVDPAKRIALKATVGAGEEPLLLVATKAISSIAKETTVDQGIFMREMAETLRKALPTWRLLFKLHPTEREEAYREWLTGVEQVSVNREMNIVDALAIADGMVSIGISSPSYYAKLLGVPQVNIRFAGYTLDVGHLPNFEGIPIVYDMDRLAKEVVRFGPVTILSPATFDGKAGERIAAIIEEEGSVIE